MTVKLLTANTLASELGVPCMRITRAVHRRVLLPDFQAGRTLLFHTRRIPRIRATIGL